VAVIADEAKQSGAGAQFRIASPLLAMTSVIESQIIMFQLR